MLTGWVPLLIAVCHDAACLRFLTVRSRTTRLCYIWQRTLRYCRPPQNGTFEFPTVSNKNLVDPKCSKSAI